MNVRNIMGAIMVAGIFGAVIADANAQGVTREEVKHEQRRAQMNSVQDSVAGGGSSATDESGTKDGHPNPSSSDSCVGPVSFCNIYFGS
jgi:hypothetical protein